jgi:steroid delta-isomerase-like uncharacterized protein
MTVDEVIRKQVDAFNRHDAKGFASCYASSADVQDPQYPEPLHGTDAVTKDLTDWLTAFPDIQGRLTRTVVNGETYAAEWSMSGTHEGPLNGPGGHIPATNRKVSMNAAIVGRIDAHGCIVEEHRYYDLAGVMSQLGLMQ